MIAASCVIISHSVPLALGPGVHEPLQACIAPLDLGKAAVRVFFAISGFFVMKSFDTRRSTTAFALARAARIVPALLLVWSITSIMAASGVTFAGNPFPNAVNGSLWTLSYEVAFYYSLTLAGLCGLYAGTRFAAVLTTILLAFTAAEEHLIGLDSELVHLGLPFLFGMAVYRYRSRVPLAWPIVLALLLLAWAFPTHGTWSIALGYAAFWIGATARPLRAYNRVGDYSYGTYIFAWPAQQVIASMVPGISPVSMMLTALPVVWSLGALSWHLVEKPALDAAKRLKLGQGTCAPRGTFDRARWTPRVPPV